MIRWVRIELSYAVFALCIRDGIVVDAAPIARWTIGKDQRKVADYYRRKGATFVDMGERDEGR